MVRISYQGVPGAYSEAAAIEMIGHIGSPHTYTGRESFEDVFEDLIIGRAEFGVIPIENTLGGSIHENYDNLLKYHHHDIEGGKQIYIHGDHDFRVRHCLLVLPGVKMEEVRKVISHPQALAQCSSWIKDNLNPKAKKEPVYDTAGSAKLISSESNSNPYANSQTAAICSDTAAKHYGMIVLARDIQDVEFNVTRFLLLSRTPCMTPTRMNMSGTILNSPRLGSGLDGSHAHANKHLLKTKTSWLVLCL